MSFLHWLGGIFDRGGQQRADQANADLTSTLSADSPYWQASQLTGDGDILQGAAQLQNANIGVDTSAVDADTDQLQGLQDTFGDIQQNGGKMSAAMQHQAEADVANTGIKNLKAGGQQAANTVLDADQNERNFAASGKNQSRAQILANALKKQTWNTAVSHANFEAALAGKGIENTDTNLAQALAMSAGEGANAARSAQRGTTNSLNQLTFNQAMQNAQMIASAMGQAAGGIAGMGDAASSVSGEGGAANSAVNSGYSAQTSYSGGSGGSAGYAMTGPVVGSQANIGSTTGVSRLAAPSTAPTPQPETYVNPISGSTVNANYPSDVSSWGSWLTDGSSLVT